MNREIDQNGCRAAAPQGFVELNDRAFASDEVMARLLAQSLKDRLELRVHEFPRDDGRDKPRITGRETEPFEIAVMAGGDDAWPRRPDGTGEFIPTFKLNQPAIILPVDARVPKEIDHRAGKLLVGLAGDPGALRIGKAVAKRRPQIAQRDATAAQIEHGRERAGKATELDRDRPRQARDDHAEETHGPPFELVTERFP